MNTKTMRLPPRRVLTPSGTTNKHKERDDSWPKPITTTKLPKQDKPIPRPGSEPITSLATSISDDKGVVEPMPSNHLLAGYLAHEYLTKGTLMGQPWASPGEKLKGKEEDEEEVSNSGEAAVAPPCRNEDAKERYGEVAGLLKGGVTHLPDVVNPTQLARFLHLL